MRWPSYTRSPTSIILFLLVLVVVVYFLQRQPTSERFTSIDSRQLTMKRSDSQYDQSMKGTSGLNEREKPELQRNVDWQRESIMSRRDASGWSAVDCVTSRVMRPATIHTQIGNFTVYIRGNASEDASITRIVLTGRDFFEKDEITKFLQVSKHLPLIDLGANVGLVSLQAAVQGRQVVAVEAIFDNAVRVCRSAKDFGHGDLVRVVQNAVSSEEGPVTLAMDEPTSLTHFTLGKAGKYQPTTSYAVVLDRLLEVVTFKRAAIKIDVEGHEGHALAGGERLFRELDISIVWMEWEHVKKLREFGAEFVIDFMRRHKMAAFDLMTGKPLDINNYKKWPFSVLWKKVD